MLVQTTWSRVVELTARGLVKLLRDARGSCVSVRPVLLLNTVGLEYRPLLATEIAYILRLLTLNGFVSHILTRKQGRRRYRVYVFCREETPYTDGLFNPENARLLWELAKNEPFERAVKEVSEIILEAEGELP
jgi:hypothetical protein